MGSDRRRSVPRGNNMDALRLTFAALVVVFHLGSLSLAPELAFLAAPAIADWAVRGFFIISGFLIFQSFEQSSGLRSYAEKRIRRIYPAYVAVVVFWALAGLLLTSRTVGDYFGGDWAKYLLNNLLFMNYRHPGLPGVFGHNALDAVNGSLWTIKIEVMFYAAVPALALLFRHVRRDVAMAAIYALSILYYWQLNHLAGTTGNAVLSLYAKQLPGQMCYFIGGAAIYYHLDWFLAQRRWLIPAAALLLVGSEVVGVEATVPACGAVLVMGAAFGPHLGNAGRYGDFSYGLYIWHFPIIQTAIATGLFDLNVGLAVGAAASTAMLAAYASWRVLERPFLARQSHYRLAEATPAATAAVHILR